MNRPDRIDNHSRLRSSKGPRSTVCGLGRLTTNIRWRYVWARGQRCEGFTKKVDLDPIILGKVGYQGYESDGTCIAEYSEGYPWQTFFRGTSWEGAS